MPNLNVKKLTLMMILLLAAVSGWRMGHPRVLPQVAVAVVAAVAMETAIGYKRQKKLVWSDSAAITGLIIGGVAAPQAPLGSLLLAVVAAMVSKYLIRVERRNIFNPAAFGLFVGTVALGLHLSWWIDSNHILTLIIGSLLLVKLTGRWRLVLAFLASFTALLAVRSWLTAAPLGPELYLFVSIASFFIFFMATDPRTAPIRVPQQTSFALVIAAGSFLSVIYHPSSIFLGGLLLANLLAAWLNHRTLHPRRSPTPKPADAVQTGASPV